MTKAEAKYIATKRKLDKLKQKREKLLEKVAEIDEKLVEIRADYERAYDCYWEELGIG